MAKAKSAAKESKFVVIKPFRDINNFNKEHKEGHDVSHFDSERLEKLIKNGLVEKQSNDQ